ncbi:MAG: TetR/AcrR family transcriptional regulator [Bacteroides sp.]|nr:TetR/AcrR family transcriptional regulator [Bacteroides sp.]
MEKTESKDYILERTFYLLLTKGYDGVSISDIQKETGMSRGLLYHYFGSKEELFRMAGERFIIDVFFAKPYLTEGFGLPELIDYVIKQYDMANESWNRRFGNCGVTIANYDFLFYQLVQKEERIALIYKNLRTAENLAWANAARVSLERGHIRDIFTPQRIALHFITLLDGLWVQTVEEKNSSFHSFLTRQLLLDYYKLLLI